LEHARRHFATVGVKGAMLEARGLTKYYSAIPAARDVSFTLRRGEVLGLLGPNGSGKSTTVSMLVGLTEPSGGNVWFDGRDVSEDLLGYKAKLGYVPEEAVLYSYLTGPEYLTLVGNLRGLAPRTIRQRVDGFLALFGLAEDAHAPMSAYSKGMRQKILISAALLHDPAIIVLDEPDSGLDVMTMLVLRSLVRALAADGRLIIYSSHVLQVIEQVATNVLILHESRVVGYDSVARLHSLPDLPSLEQVFRQLVVDTDTDVVARDLMGVMRS
jgi:ABC-2 type transport system ATP-binding protein